MQAVGKYFSGHQILRRFSAAMFYGVVMAIAMNFFWKPGNIYSSGFTGLAQVLDHTFKFNNMPVMLVLVNVPLTLVAWKLIGRRLAFFEIVAILIGSVAIQLVHAPAHPLTDDPLMNAIFGGAINGLAVGMALRQGVATGGLDIIGIIGNKYYNIKIFPISVAFNAFIMIGSAMNFGWQYAFYSIIGIVVSSWVTSSLYTRQQQMQVMIVTDKKDEVIEAIQTSLRRGITIVNDAEGGYLKDSKNILFTVTTLEEIFSLKEAVKKSDPKAFVSVWKVDQTFGRFYETSY